MPRRRVAVSVAIAVPVVVATLLLGGDAGDGAGHNPELAERRPAVAMVTMGVMVTAMCRDRPQAAELAPRRPAGDRKARD
jgi:hypothetical protein